MAIKDRFVGRRVFQPLFERLFKLSLRGMNYGLGGMLSTSGEKNLVQMVRHSLDKIEKGNKVLMDVGANDGQYADLLIEAFTPDDKIICFEPSRFSFAELSKRHGSKSNVELVAMGLGSKAEKRNLFFDSEGSGWASVFERADTGFNRSLTHSEEITLITLDEFCQSKDIRKIHFLKADVEGFELEIFKGAKNMLPNIDFIQFEFSFANFNSKTYLFDFFEILSEFRIYRVLRDGIYEIQYDPRYEVLMTTNYLAVNKRTAL
jgi:FkbM family methyltransferase